MKGNWLAQTSQEENHDICKNQTHPPTHSIKDNPLQQSSVFFFCDGEEGYQEKFREV